MNIIDDLVYSMLSYSRNYQPYVYSWGKRVGRDLVQEKLELKALLSIKAKNIFEHGIMAGAVEQLTSEKISAPKTAYSRKYYHLLRNKSLRVCPEEVLLKAAYPYLYLSPGSHTLLYWIGRETGTKLGKKYRHSLSALEKISNKLNIGKVETKKNKIILHDSAFAKNAKTGKRICSYYAGFAAGFLSSKKRYNVIERKCMARGDKKCEFIIIP